MRPLLCLLTAAIPLVHAASPNMELAKSVFDPRVMSNAEESPIPGLYQFAQGAEVFYISADGRYVMQGEMIDLQTQNNVTEAFRASERVKALTQLDPKTMISVMPNAPQYQVTVFIDVDCPYCRVMQQNILEYTQRGIAIRYLAFPRSGPESVAALRMSQVWCSPDRLSALLLAETDQPLPNSRGDCTNIIRDHFATGLRMGIASTPSVILEDGTLIPGFVAPANLEAILSQHLRQREPPPEPRSPVRRPPPPYTTRSSGRSATSGSRLFISMRSGASVCQLFALSSVPRGARTSRGAFIIVPLFSSLPSLFIDAAPAAAAQSDSPSGEGTSRGCHRATTPGCVGDNMCA